MKIISTSLIGMVFIALSMFGLPATAEVTQPFDIYLIGYWHFDETNGDALDGSPNNTNNGVLNGDATRVSSTLPYSVNSLSLSGAGYMHAPGGSGPIDLVADYTVASWFKASVPVFSEQSIFGAHVNSDYGLYAAVSGGEGGIPENRGKLRWLHRSVLSNVGGVNLYSNIQVDDG